MRWAAYAGVSTTLAAGVVVRALAARPNFYSAAVYLAQSSANLMIVTNFVFLCACILLLGLQRLLYGTLRPIETEQLYERAWVFVTETCLSMTIFRGSFGAWFMVMFFSLLAGKIWGWIGEGRVEILEQQPPANPRLFHSRLTVSLWVSVSFAIYMLNYSIRTVLAQARPDMMVMFGFEFAVLTILATSTAARYAICVAEIYIVHQQKTSRIIELRAERLAARQAADADGTGQPAVVPGPLEIDEAEVEVEGWEEKGRWIFYLDLVTDFLKLTVYVAFFSVLLGFYGLPLHIMRDLFLSFRSFFKRVADFAKYRNATRDMNVRYPDATPDEVASDDVCIICREEMRPIQPNENATESARANPLAQRMRPKKLPCGHILHFSCLRSWLERQQNCPTCRRPVLVSPALRAGQEPLLIGNAGAGAAAVGHGPDQAGRNRARVFNFGPLRIGIGAGGNDLINDLAQRIHDGDARNPQDRAGNVGGQRNFGFGFGFGRRRDVPDQVSTAPTTSIQAQLDQLTHTIQQQVNSLQLSRQQLQHIRSLNNELNRLRNLPPNNPTADAARSGAPNPPPTLPFPFSHGQLPPRPSDVPPAPSRALALSSHQQQQALSSEQGNLPDGVTLPPGWTLVPLYRSEPPPPRPAGNSATSIPTTQVTNSSIPTSLRPGRPNGGSATPMGLPDPPSLPPTNQPSTFPDPPARLPTMGNGVNPPSNLPNISNPAPSGSVASGTPAVADETPRWSFASSSHNTDQQTSPSATTEPADPPLSEALHLQNGQTLQPGSSNLSNPSIQAEPGKTGPPPAGTGDSGQGKGKGKPVTIEDLVDDVD